MNRTDIREGSVVRAADGEKLGKVGSCLDDSFVIEKGLFFHREYEARYDDVSRADDGEIFLKLNKEELLAEHSPAEPIAEAEPLEPGMAAETGMPGEARIAREEEDEGFESGRSVREETRVPLVEEQLKADKHLEKVGDIVVKKEVITEEKTVTVPVTHEEVRVETVRTDERAAGAPPSESETRVPLYEEKVDIEKQAMKTGEVRVSKETIRGEEEISESLRKEKAEVKTEGGVRRREPDERRP